MNQNVTNKTISVIVTTAAVVAGIAVVAWIGKKCVASHATSKGNRR